MTTNGDHVGPLSYQPPKIVALYSERRNHHWSSRDIQKRRPQAIRRQLEDCDSESLAWSFCGALPQSGSVLVFVPPFPLARMRIWGIPGPPGDLEDAQRFDAGTAYS